MNSTMLPPTARGPNHASAEAPCAGLAMGELAPAFGVTCPDATRPE